MEILRIIWRKKFVIVGLVLLVALLPMAVTKESIVLSKTIVTAVGIDVEDGEYTVYAEVLIFNFDPFGVPEREIHKATDKDIEKAIVEIGRNRGRTVSFSHCSVIVLGKGLDKEEDLGALLMPFYKRPDLNNGAVVIWTGNGVEELLNSSIELGDARSAMLQQIAEFNRKSKSHTHTNLERVMRAAIGGERSVKVAKISLVEEELVNSGAVKELQLSPITAKP